LDVLTGGRSRSLAAAVIDRRAVPTTRLALIGADPGTRFEIGSITKALTGMLLADAVERGEITLDTEVGAVIPTSAGTDFGSITVKELCTQTSGLPRVALGPLTVLRGLRFALLGFDPNRGIDASEMLRQAARQRLSDRGRYRYSNLGAAVLGQLLAIVTGTEYPRLLRERILAPIEMTGSVVAGRRDAAAPGSSSSGLPRRPWILDGYAPAGGVISTIGDMALLAEALVGGSAPGLASMTPIEGTATGQPHRTSGMFWVIGSIPGRGGTMVGHTGRTGGYSALLVLLPKTQRAVIVLENVARRPREHERLAAGLLKVDS
jgi:CubicO group peptidase (beta-lactamase class C family)